MPHVIIEYTDNIKERANIPDLLQKINDSLVAKGDVFPIGGIRSRAIELKDYRVADGTEDDAFVHATMKIGAGRAEEKVSAAGNELFEIIKDHFGELFKERYLALSMEIAEFTRATYKHNNIHQRYKKENQH